MIKKGAKLSNAEEVLVMATAGNEMFKRRRGLKSAIAEIKLQKYLMNCGIKSPARASIDCLVRGGLLLLPSYFLGTIYRLMLRK
jgi:hypothetical protein